MLNILLEIKLDGIKIICKKKGNIMGTVEPIRDMKDLRNVEKILARKPKDLLLFTIGTNCGLRISDIVALNVGDVKDKTHIRIIEQKTGKPKTFPINSKLKPMLDSFVKDKSLEEKNTIVDVKTEENTDFTSTIEILQNQIKLKDNQISILNNNAKNLWLSSLQKVQRCCNSTKNTKSFNSTNNIKIYWN